MQANVMVLTSWSFKDALVQAYTLPYLSIVRDKLPSMYKITLVTSEQRDVAISMEEQKKINQDWIKVNMELIPLPYTNFGFQKIITAGKELFYLYRRIKKENIGIIHAFCTPAGTIGYLLSKVSGAALIVDSYEPHSQAMVENGTWKKNGLSHKILFTAEKWQTKRARHLIATTFKMKEYADFQFNLQPPMFSKPACVDFSLFHPAEKDEGLASSLGIENKIVCVYAGKLGGIYLKQEVFDFVKSCHDFWRNDFRFLMLTNATDEEVLMCCRQAGVDEGIVVKKFVSHKDIPAYLALADFGINPVKPVPSKQYCTSMKDGEYWAMGLPVVITKNISDDSDIIEQNRIGYVLKRLDPSEYQTAVRAIDALLKEDRSALQRRIYTIAQHYRSFSIADEIYSSIYN
jgi:glycosyltransferase involved in cell wall biosynthesis